MRIKPWALTGCAALIAAATVGVMVVSVDPVEADQRLLTLLWISLGIGGWATVTTILLAFRMAIARSVWIAFWWLTGAFTVLLLVRAGRSDSRLLGAVLFVTLLLSLITWWRLRNGRT